VKPRRYLLDTIAIDAIPSGEKFWHFKIPGEPAPWKRKGGFGSRSFNPSAKDQNAIAWSVRSCCPQLFNNDDSKLWGVRLAFHSPRLTTTDIDNLAKNFLDALNGTRIAWTDDCKVREIFAIVVPDSEAYTEGVIYELSPDYLASWSVLK
jgi:Holliday junction resolvase RusA-like endonuclease